MPDWVYLDHAATGYPQVFAPRADRHANASSGHALGRRARAALEADRAAALQALRAPPDSGVVFTSGATEANNMVLLGGDWDYVVGAPTEHPAVLNTLHWMEANTGTEVVWVPVDGTGLVSPWDVRRAVQARHGRRGLVTLMLVNNEIGTRQDLRAVAAAVSPFRPGVWLHTDAVQALGHLPLDVTDLGVDFLTLSGHKYHAPAGIGLLWHRQRPWPLRRPALLHGGEQQDGVRPGTEPLPLIAAMVEALVHAARNTRANAPARLAMQRRYLADVLRPYESTGLVRMTGHSTLRAPHHLSFCVRGGSNVVARLEAAGLLCSGGSACSSGSGLRSHVLVAIGVPAPFLDGAVRLTLSPFTTDDEVRRAGACLGRVLAEIAGGV